MKDYTHVIGIGGNIHQPNPRLPAYIIPSLVRDNVSQILLTSSLDAAKKFSDGEYASEKIGFETNQKLQFLHEFGETFFPEGPHISIGIESESDKYEHHTWLRLWNIVDGLLTQSERELINGFFSKLEKTVSGDEAKIYAVRHAFWFYDVSFSEIDTSSFETLGGPSEIIFNIIRKAILYIDDETLFEIFGRRVHKNFIPKTIFPFESRVVQYGEATRKTGKKHKSIEYTADEEISDIYTFYQGRQQLKSGLHRDIELIHQAVDASDYQDFYHDFLRKYQSDSLVNKVR